jgi:tRNA G18 (ribose-2'-O)-methylase SpoU
MHKYTTNELVAMRPTLEQTLAKKRNPIIFVLNNIRSLQNVGLFFRLADAILAEKIYLTGYTGFPRREDDSRDERIILHAEKEINKTAIKLVSHVPWEQKDDPLKLLNDLGNRGYQRVAVEQTDISLDFRKTKYQFPLALIFGHERTGVEDQLLTMADKIIHIPMIGTGNSHNVAMSAAIVSYHLLDSLPA